MVISFDKVITPRSATKLGILFSLPFAFAFTTAVTRFAPFLNLIASNGRATAFGLTIFYIGMIGLPIAFLLNLLSMLSVKIALRKWSIDGKISFHPKAINLTIAAITLVIAAIFGGHLIIDTLACWYGNILACD